MITETSIGWFVFFIKYHRCIDDAHFFYLRASLQRVGGRVCVCVRQMTIACRSAPPPSLFHPLDKCIVYLCLSVWGEHNKYTILRAGLQGPNMFLFRLGWGDNAEINKKKKERKKGARASEWVSEWERSSVRYYLHAVFSDGPENSCRKKANDRRSTTTHTHTHTDNCKQASEVTDWL